MGKQVIINKDQKTSVLRMIIVKKTFCYHHFIISSVRIFKALLIVILFEMTSWVPFHEDLLSLDSEKHVS